MKIISLNVNKFEPLHLTWSNKAKEILDMARKYLDEDENNVVLLQEFPTRFIGELKDELGENYEVIKPDHKGRAYGYTIAITTKESGWELQDKGDFKQEKRRSGTICYENKFVEIKNEIGHKQLRILGIHAPWQGKRIDNDITTFWRALVRYANQKKDEKECFIIVGDMNADTIKGSVYYEEMNEIKKAGYIMAVEELGDDVITYFHKETRIDHVMASPALEGKVTATVEPKEKLELSDHAVIIVNIEE